MEGGFRTLIHPATPVDEIDSSLEARRRRDLVRQRFTDRQARAERLLRAPCDDSAEEWPPT